MNKHTPFLCSRYVNREKKMNKLGIRYKKARFSRLHAIGAQGCVRVAIPCSNNLGNHAFSNNIRNPRSVGCSSFAQ